MENLLVSVDWLKQNLDNPNLILLDASIKMADSSFKDNPESVQISGARHFDIKAKFSDSSSNLPNMLPSSAQFEKACQDLGINNDSQIVVYDATAIYTSPRVWWMFQTMGFENIAVLDGGLPEWIKQGYSTECMHAISYPKGDFTASFNPDAVKSLDFITSNLHTKECLVVDARSSGRFTGTAPEPRAGLRSGNIPDSINIPYTSLLEDGRMKSKDAMAKILKSKLDENQALTFSCGSGVTACIVLLGMQIAFGNGNYSVYDGSWTEWATIHA